MKRMLIMAAVIFFTLSLAGIATAGYKTYPGDYSLTGKVVTIDVLSRTLTIRPTGSPFAIGTGSEFTFKMNEIVNVRMCEQDKTVQDINVGETVTVEYHKEAGRLYADAVDIPTPLVACLLEEK